MDNFAFDKKNYLLLAIGMLIIIVGFILMSGPGSSENTFNPDIFSARRIKVAPAVCLFGFVFIMYAIMHKPADKRADKKEEQNG
ncbi:MAG TPA: DUF3098 domain-containing protein [Prevotellaceae bacterium]|nr:DUF3098 domain-containing protein [Prevotellaceae bacterium]HBE55632.1 DUF3098 domain-containing protein [Prevotellaceae bacterium]